MDPQANNHTALQIEMSHRQRHFASFWTLQLVGFGIFGIIVFIFVVALPHLEYQASPISDFAGLLSIFFSTLVLRTRCRKVWQRTTSWPHALWRSGLWATVLGLPCALIAQWIGLLETHSPMDWRNLLSGWAGCFLYVPILFTWCVLYFGTKHQQMSASEQGRAVWAEALARERQLEALRYQLNPHFLFNVLNSVSTLVAEGDKVAANRILSQLADFLRETLDGNETQIPLVRELERTEQYLQIEKLRLGERLEFEFVVDKELKDYLVPSMLLQPLAENAIRHGIAPAAEGGKVIIKVLKAETVLRIVVSDNGIGSRESGNRKRAGIGLSNTLERLRASYGESYSFSVGWPEQGGCRIEISLPLAAVAQDLSKINKGKV